MKIKNYWRQKKMNNNFIEAEQFLKLDNKVQKVFLDWWKPQYGDIIYFDNVPYPVLCVYSSYIGIYCENTGEFQEININYNNIIPLFQIHHFIDFIEEKTKGKVEIYYAWDYYTIAVRNTSCDGDDPQFNTGKTDLLQALFEVAVKVAEMEENNNE